MFRFIDLFAGIGGLRLAFEAAGGRCVYSSEIDPFARQTYFANFGDTPFGDIRRAEAADIPVFDVLVAGFPCRPFSVAGVSKRNSLCRAHGFKDAARGTLFFEICRIAASHRPAALLLENVPHLIRHDCGRTFRVVRAALEELGYTLKWELLDARFYVPQKRQRLFIAAFLDPGAAARFRFPVADGPVLRLGDLLEAEVPEKYALSDRLWSCLRRHAARHARKGNGFGYCLADLGSPSRALSARYYKDGSEILIPQAGRNPCRLTPRECARLQGFPDDFVIPVSDAQAYRQFGNAVAVPLARAIAANVAQALAESKEPVAVKRAA